MTFVYYSCCFLNVYSMRSPYSLAASTHNLYIKPINGLHRKKRVFPSPAANLFYSVPGVGVILCRPVGTPDRTVEVLLRPQAGVGRATRLFLRLLVAPPTLRNT
jgi:hypothetical protein